MHAVLVRETDMEPELITLQDELADAQRRLAVADEESLSIIQKQIRQIRHQIKSYQKKLYEKRRI